MIFFATQIAQDRGLVANSNFVTKTMQLHQMAQLRQGVVIAGSAGTGKTSIITTLIDALCILPGNHGNSSGRFEIIHHYDYYRAC